MRYTSKSEGFKLPLFVTDWDYSEFRGITKTFRLVGIKDLVLTQLECASNDDYSYYGLLHSKYDQDLANLVKQDVKKFCKKNPNIYGTRTVRREYNKILAKHFK